MQRSAPAKPLAPAQPPEPMQPPQPPGPPQPEAQNYVEPGPPQPEAQPDVDPERQEFADRLSLPARGVIRMSYGAIEVVSDKTARQSIRSLLLIRYGVAKGRGYNMGEFDLGQTLLIGLEVKVCHDRFCDFLLWLPDSSHLFSVLVFRHGFQIACTLLPGCFPLVPR